jgi:outer membrane cobalamin receptor
VNLRVGHPKSAVRGRKPNLRRTPNSSREGTRNWRGRKFNLPAVIFFCLVAASAARAATIEGTVLDPSGRAVSNAHVRLIEGLSPLEAIRSGPQGHYRFRHIGPGEYTLIANSPGLEGSSGRIHVRSGGVTREINLHLRLSAVQQHVVVSASLGGALASQLGSSVSVITRREIEDQGAQSLGETLRQVPGVVVNRTGGLGGVTSVFVRGGSSNYNLVMMDGIPLNEFGGDFDFSPLPASGVERVEVTRGPESALYGSDAVASVINIVSRRGEGPPHFSGIEEVGSHLTRRFATAGSGITKGLSWAYDLSRLDTDGVVQNNQYSDQSAFLSLGYSPNPRRQFRFNFFGNANNAGAPGPFGSDPDHLFPGIDTVSRDQQNLFGYGASYSDQITPRFRQVTSVGVSVNRYFFVSPFGDSYSHNLRAAVNTQSQMAFSSRDVLVAGIAYNRDQIKNTYIADANNTPFLLPRTSFAAFAENRWVPGRLALNAGVRLDDIRTNPLPAGAFGSRPLMPASSVTQVNPQVSAAYLLREGGAGDGLGLTRWHASFGTGIRAPDGFELAFTNNPHLKPEKSVSFDTGVEQRFFRSRASLGVTYFYNRFEDQIVVLGGSLTNLSTFISDNLGNSRAQGLEVSLRAQPARSVSVSGGYTFLDTSILALNGADVALAPFHVGQPLLRQPRNSGFFDVTWLRGPLMLNLNGYLRGSVLDLEPNLGLFACAPPSQGGPGLPCLFTNGGYTLANAGFSYRLPYGVELYGRLNNFLNQKYEEALGYPALRLNFLAGIRFELPAK